MAQTGCGGFFCGERIIRNRDNASTLGNFFSALALFMFLYVPSALIWWALREGKGKTVAWPWKNNEPFPVAGMLFVYAAFFILAQAIAFFAIAARDQRIGDGKQTTWRRTKIFLVGAFLFGAGLVAKEQATDFKFSNFKFSYGEVATFVGFPLLGFFMMLLCSCRTRSVDQRRAMPAASQVPLRAEEAQAQAEAEAKVQAEARAKAHARREQLRQVLALKKHQQAANKELGRRRDDGGQREGEGEVVLFAGLDEEEGSPSKAPLSRSAPNP